MSTKKKSNKMSFWLVVLGLFLVIGFVAGSTYILNDQGLISIGGELSGDMPDGPPADFEEGETVLPRSDFENEGLGVNSEAFMGVFITLLQIAIVVVIVAGGQWLYTWLVNRQRHSVAT